MSPIYWGYSWKIFTKQQQHRHSKHHAAQIQTQTITWINKPQPKANSCTEDTLYSGQHITNVHQLTGIGNQKFSFLCKHLLSRDRSLPVQPAISMPTNLCAPPEFLKKICLLCLIIMQFCYLASFWLIAAWSAFLALFTWSERTTCAKDHGLFILITHKATRSEIRSRGGT